MAIPSAARPAVAIAAVLGLAAGALAVALAGPDARQCGTGSDDALLARIAELEAELARRPPPGRPAASAPSSRSAGRAAANALHPSLRAGTGQSRDAIDVDQQLKDLLTLAWNDRRSMRAKLEDFLGAHPGSEGAAIASKGVFELVDNRDVLPDADLAALYLGHHDPSFRRVLAQVASARGDNSLIELHVAEAATGLLATSADERRQALVELARARHVSAADRAAPLLRDRDSAVVLDALLALRANGNQRHVPVVEPLLAHPDESVRWLARDAIDELRLLSDQARTRIADRELAAELPPLPVAATLPQCGSGMG